MRFRSILVSVALAGTATFLSVSPAAAQDPTTTTALPPDAVAIGDGLAFTGAVITTPGAEPRIFDAYHAAVFAQSFIGAAYWSQPVLQAPPPTLPVSRVDVTGRWPSGDGTMAVYYASDGTTSWISWPQSAPPAPEPINPPPPSVWWVGPPAVIPAFNGTAQLVPTLGTSSSSAKASEQAAAAAEARTEDSHNTAILIAFIGGGLAVVVAGTAIWWRRRRTPATA
jgi:hypothetical protein